MNNKWQEICKKLQETLSSGIYKVWILPLQAVIKPDSLELIAPSAFVVNWLKKRLYSTIEEAAMQVFGHKVAIDLHAPLIQNETSTKHSSESALAKRQLSLPVKVVAPQTIPHGWRYAFETFVVGATNNVAYAAAQNMVRSNASVNMLFLSSSSGLGKTHLTQAVGHALCAASNRANLRVEYLTAEDFASAFVQALRAHEIETFKDRFRDLDLLLLEDVHFLQGKEKMQNEVLSTIKTLQTRGSRVVLTSSFSPFELKNVDNQLVSRFCSGFLANIEHPDADTRRRIILEKAKELQIILPNPVLDLLTDQLIGDIRQLESCVHTLALKEHLLACKLSVEMASDILTQYAQENPQLTIESIIRKICEGFHIDPENLKSKSRRQDHVLARNTIFYLARRHTDLSLEDIGRHCNRRHSTVLKGIAAVEREINRETSLGRQIASLVALVEKS